jgi:excisionase family DNA binding protein
MPKSATVPRLPRSRVTSHALDNRRTYTVDEVAAIVGISRSTAYECVRRGEIPSRRFGRRIVVLRHELDRLLTAEQTITKI